MLLDDYISLNGIPTGIARERLGVLKELCRINQDLRERDHFSGAVRGRDLARLADRAQDRLVQEKESRLLRKFQFEPDPVEKLSLTTLPLSADEVRLGEDRGKVMTSRDFTRQRMQLQKLNSEQSLFERRTKRRAFLDKSIIGPRKGHVRDRARGSGWGIDRYAVLTNVVSGEANRKDVDVTTAVITDDRSPANDVDDTSKLHEHFRSPSLPALNAKDELEPEVEETGVRVHPSLSGNHSASLDYLPVIRDVTRQQDLVSSSPHVSLADEHLPPIAKT